MQNIKLKTFMKKHRRKSLGSRVRSSVLIFFILNLFVFFFLATPRTLQDLSSLTRHGTRVPAVRALSPNHWTIREFPGQVFLKLTPKSWSIKRKNWGLPWWHSGQESTCQRRGYRFDPWFRKIPHAAEQLSPWATTTEPALHNYWSPCTLEPVCRNKRNHRNEKPAHQNEE